MPEIRRHDPRVPTTLVAIPGTGSDADYVRRAFGPAAREMGLTLVAIEPTTDLVEGHRRQLDALAETAGPLIVGGVSIGAAIALEWALHNPCAGVWAALPAWSGDPAHAPAAWSASATARALTTDGLDATIATMAASSPRWLAAELDRSWRALHPGLVDQLDRAAAFHSPTVDEIATLRAPLAVTAAIDDPVHPHEVGMEWARVAPRSALTEVTLDEWGTDPSTLGFGCARGWSGLG
ncbi:alpha/beta fold hydrolase [Gordonia sp. CPCC 206044]|uniref:alpha/beta hydrolase n=1 Tax=Gordonia sp. CPCC 206044 TaxID=3140793 RepID=UPI003AF34661